MGKMDEMLTLYRCRTRGKRSEPAHERMVASSLFMPILNVEPTGCTEEGMQKAIRTAAASHDRTQQALALRFDGEGISRKAGAELRRDEVGRVGGTGGEGEERVLHLGGAVSDGKGNRSIAIEATGPMRCTHRVFPLLAHHTTDNVITFPNCS